MKKVHLVSYPRSGNTWLRLLVANVLHPERDCGYVDINYMVPDIHQMGRWNMKKVLKYRTSVDVFKSHHMMHPDYECVVYLIRDVRDVLISCYHYVPWTNVPKCTFQKYFELFIRGEVPFHSWQMHVRTWLENANRNKNIYLVKYEDLLVNTHKVFSGIVRFVGLKIGEDVIQQAVDRTIFSKCRSRAPKERVAPGVLGFQGTSGRWKKVLTVEQQDRIWLWTGKLLEELGYERSGNGS